MLFTNEDLEELRKEAEKKYGECELILHMTEIGFRVHLVGDKETKILEPDTLELI